MIVFWRLSKARLSDARSSGLGLVAQHGLHGGGAHVGDLVAAFELALFQGRLLELGEHGGLRPGSSMSGSTSTEVTSHFSLPAMRASSSCAAHSFLISSCAIARASSSASSSTSLGAGLDHRDRLGRAGDDEVQVGLLDLLQGRVDDEVIPDEPDAHGADRAQERQVGDRQCGRCPVDAQDVVRVDLVDAHDRRDDLDLVAEALGPERPDRPVGHARGQDRPLARAALALDEPAGNLAGGVHALFNIDGQREEVDPLPRRACADGGHQDQVVA